MKHVEVGPDGARLGYVELDGDGPALVYLHGLGSCSPGNRICASRTRRPVFTSMK